MLAVIILPLWSASMSLGPLANISSSGANIPAATLSDMHVRILWALSARGEKLFGPYGD